MISESKRMLMIQTDLIICKVTKIPAADLQHLKDIIDTKFNRLKDYEVYKDYDLMFKYTKK